MKNLYHLFVTRYKLQVTSYKLHIARFKRFTSHLLPHTSYLKRFTSHLTPLTSYLIPLSAFLFLPFFAFAQNGATVTDVVFSCGTVTVTYNLEVCDSANVTLKYSPDKCEWFTATTEGDVKPGNGKTIVWDDLGSASFGKFYYKIEYQEIIIDPVEHDYVRIDTLKWATCNVAEPGTFAASPTDTGWHYQWSINVGWRPIPGTPSESSPIGSTWITPINDNMPQGWVCDQPCPAGWRLPTSAEYVTLAGYVVPVSSGLDRLDGIAGRFFDSGVPCQPLLFLPAAGYRGTSDGLLGNVGTNGYYWSSTPDGTTNAYGLYFNSTGMGPSSSLNKTFGFTVRCVSEN